MARLARQVSDLCEFGTEEELLEFMRAAGLKPGSEQWKKALEIWRSEL